MVLTGVEPGSPGPDVQEDAQLPETAMGSTGEDYEWYHRILASDAQLYSPTASTISSPDAGMFPPAIDDFSTRSPSPLTLEPSAATAQEEQDEEISSASSKQKRPSMVA